MVGALTVMVACALPATAVGVPGVPGAGFVTINVLADVAVLLPEAFCAVTSTNMYLPKSSDVRV